MTNQDKPLDLSQIQAALLRARLRGHRQLILLSSSPPTDPDPACHLLNALQVDQQVAWYGSAPAAAERANMHVIANRAWDTALGREFSALVIDTHQGFDCDAMAALSGTVKAGGVLLLLTPDISTWPAQRDPESQRISAWRETPLDHESLYLTRFCRILIAASKSVALSSELNARVLHEAPEASICSDRCAAQRSLVKQLVEHVLEDSVKSVLVTADRGRGKSAALGMVAASLVAKHRISVLVCAHGKPAVDVLYRHYRRSLPHDVTTELRFCAPDSLHTLRGSADLLLVDEAANIPLPLLQVAATSFKHTVFASTVQGYEGAGRGFAIRFTQWLLENGISHCHKTLEQPIRWQANDPLETFTNQAFLLDAPLQPARSLNAALNLESARLLPLHSIQLAHNEPLLREVFGLLVEAHYKTRPNDLRHILDSNNLQCFALFCGDHCVAAALLAREGPLLDISLRQGILKKIRRPTAHLIPQLLAQYTGMASALDLHIARVVRIAVHPKMQRQGLGSLFIRRLQEWCKVNSTDSPDAIDALAAQFSASTENLAFWVKNGFVACHRGARKHSSGGHRSMVVINALSEPAKLCADLAKTFFHDALQFDHDDAEKKQANIDIGTSNHPAQLANFVAASLYDEFVLARYIAKERSFRDSHAAVARAAIMLIENRPVPLDDTEERLLRAIQAPSCDLADVAKLCAVTGKKALESKLRLLLQRTIRKSP